MHTTFWSRTQMGFLAGGGRFRFGLMKLAGCSAQRPRARAVEYLMRYCSLLTIWTVLRLPLLPGSEPAALASEPSPKIEIRRALVYAEHADQELVADAYLPPGQGPSPAILVVHGGAWRTGSRFQLGLYAMHLAEHGYTAFCIDYRLAPRHRFPAQYQDCRCALRWITQHAEEFRIDPKRLGAIGYSAGGHLIALLATAAEDDPRLQGECDCAGSAPRLKAVVAGGAPCDFRDVPADSHFLEFLFGGSRSEKPDLYDAASPAAHVSADDPPMLFFHGSNDMLVDIESPRQMVEALQQDGVEAEFCEIEGAGHVLAALKRDGLLRATQFFDRHLKENETSHPKPPREKGPEQR